MKTGTLITDEQTLLSAQNRFGHSIPVYDDGYGQIYIHRDSMGISGIVRAQSWEEAYGICEDEFFPAATETEEEFIAEYGEDFMEDACWQEAFGFRNNSRREEDGSTSTLYQKDLNGDYLDLLTPELLEELEITLEIETPQEPEPETCWHSWHESRTRGMFIMSGRWGVYSRPARKTVSRLALAHFHFSPNCEEHAVAW